MTAQFVQLAYSWCLGNDSPLYHFACNGGQIFDEKHKILMINEIRDCMYPKFHDLYNEAEQKELETFLKYVKEWK